MKNQLLLILTTSLLMNACAHQTGAFKAPTLYNYDVGSPRPLIEPAVLHESTKEEIERGVSIHVVTTDRLPTIIYGNIEPLRPMPKNPDYGVYYPAIYVVEATDKPVMVASWPKLNRYIWQTVVWLPKAKYHLGILKYDTEASEYHFVASEDLGKTWKPISSIVLPFYEDQFESFTMNENGQGYFIARTNGVNYKTAARAHPRGYAIYATNDFGKKWEGPKILETNIDAPSVNSSCLFKSWPTKKIEDLCSIQSSIKYHSPKKD